MMPKTSGFKTTSYYPDFNVTKFSSTQTHLNIISLIKLLF